MIRNYCTAGCPTGVLGSPLFLIYVGNVASDLENPLLMFDDIKLIGAANNEATQRDVDKVGRWSAQCDLLLSLGKCQRIMEGRANPLATWTVWASGCLGTNVASKGSRDSSECGLRSARKRLRMHVVPYANFKGPQDLGSLTFVCRYSRRSSGGTWNILSSHGGRIW